MTRRNRFKRAKNRDLLLGYLRTHPCVDCAESDVNILEFDHVRGVKRKEVSSLARQACSWQTVMDEIAKCEVRCANCHRRVTVQRREARRASGVDMQEKPKGWKPDPGYIGRLRKTEPPEPEQRQIEWEWED